MSTVCKHLLISGRVQGVGFRASTYQQASALDLNGWVRNLPDGRVEVLAWGEAGAMARFLQWCQQGPLYARVTAVEVEESSPERSVSGFGIR
jgi:acylphosphatase